MGLFDGRSSSYGGDGRSQSHHSRSHSRAYSPARSTHSSASKGYYTRPSASRSNSSFFGNFGGGGSRGFSSGSSYYRRSPRQGYISYLYHKLQRMLRELWYYARRHPMKAFFAVIVPLLSAGGAIHGLMRQFGVRVPGLDGGARRMGGGYYGSAGYGSGRGGGGGLMGQAGNLMQMARAFM